MRLSLGFSVRSEAEKAKSASEGFITGTETFKHNHKSPAHMRGRTAYVLSLDATPEKAKALFDLCEMEWETGRLFGGRGHHLTSTCWWVAKERLPALEERHEEATRAAAPAALPPKVAPAKRPAAEPNLVRPKPQPVRRAPVRRTKVAPSVKKPPKAKPEFSAMAHMEFLAEQGELDEVELAMLARMKKGAGK
jgi:hypothetical protein